MALRASALLLIRARAAHRSSRRILHRFLSLYSRFLASLSLSLFSTLTSATPALHTLCPARPSSHPRYRSLLSRSELILISVFLNFCKGLDTEACDKKVNICNYVQRKRQFIKCYEIIKMGRGVIGRVVPINSHRNFLSLICSDSPVSARCLTMCSTENAMHNCARFIFERTKSAHVAPGELKVKCLLIRNDGLAMLHCRTRNVPNNATLTDARNNLRFTLTRMLLLSRCSRVIRRLRSGL